MREDLHQLKREIFANGRITKEDVEHLSSYFTGEIKKEEADFIFDLKDNIVTDKAVPEFYKWFVEVITSYLLEDEDTPGEISEEEAKWLRAKITRKGDFDRADKQLIANLKEKSITYPSILHFKRKSVLIFEMGLFGLRFVTFLAVLGSMIASIVLFITSSLKVWEGVKYAFNYVSDNHQHAKEQVVFFVEAVDGYLFATVLLIFSIGLYELFIDKIDPVSLKNDSRPNWLKINSIDDLKSSLGKVILMILIVSFFEHSVGLHYESAMDLLFLGLGVLFVSGALFLTHKGEQHKHNED